MTRYADNLPRILAELQRDCADLRGEVVGLMTANGDSGGESIRSDGGFSVARTALATTFADFATDTFTKPASWASYEIRADGWAHVIDSTGPDLHEAKVVIGADVGATTTMGTADNPKIIPCSHVASGLTAATTVVKVQVRNSSTNDGVHRASQFTYVARRTA